MLKSAPAWIQIQAIFAGAVLGGSWGLTHPSREAATIAGLQTYLQALENTSHQELQQVIQQVQAVVYHQCSSSGESVPVDLLTTPTTGLSPWITTCVVTWLHGRSSHFVPQLQHALQPLVTSSSISPPDPSPDPTYASELDLLLSVGLWWQLLLQSPHQEPDQSWELLPAWSTRLADHHLDTHLAHLLGETLKQTPHHRASWSITSFLQALEQRTGSAQEQAIAIALYSLITTSGDFSLSLVRAVRYSPLPPLSGFLVGVSSNLYNGSSHFTPLFGQSQSMPGCILAVRSQGSQPIVAELWQAAALLFTTWAGLLSPQSSSYQDPNWLTVTAPRPLLLQV